MACLEEMIWNFLKSAFSATPAHDLDHEVDDLVRLLADHQNKIKILVARLIKEQRDLQEQIHRCDKSIQHHTGQAKTLDLKEGNERVDQHLAEVGRLKGHRIQLAADLAMFRDDSIAIVDIIRDIEQALSRVHRQQLLNSTMASMQSALDVMRKIDVAAQWTSAPETPDQSIRQLLAAVQGVRQSLSTIEGVLEAALEGKEPASAP